MIVLVTLLGLFGAAQAPAEATPPAAEQTLSPPELVADAAPLYPPDAFAEGVMGPVEMEVDIDDEGRVMRVAVVQSPDPRLTQSAFGAVANFEFLPARQGEQPIPVRVRYTLNFTIDLVERQRALAEAEALRLAEQQATALQNLEGRVFVRGERRTVAGAIVSVDGTDLETLTDEDGAFALRGVPPGRQVIRVESPGFLGAYVAEEMQANVVTSIDLFLEQKPLTNNETVVQERRTQREVTQRTLTQKELTRIPGTFGDPIRAVQRLPGVARAPFGLGAVLVRGGAPEDSAILIDGHLTRQLFHLGAGPSVINNDLVERLEFFPGGQGVRFGRAIAGAIDVVTRDPKGDTFAGQASVDLLNAGFRLEGPIAGGAFFLAGRRSYVAEVLNVGDVISTFVDLPVNQLTLAPRYSDYQAKMFWKLPSNMTLGVNVFGADDVLDLALDTSGLGPTAPDNVGITLGFHRINPVWRWRSGKSHSDGQPVMRAWVSPMIETNYSENRFDESSFRLDTNRVGLRAEVEMRPVSFAGLLLGVDATGGLFTNVTDVPFVLPDERLFPRPVTSDPPRTRIEDEVLGTSSGLYAEGDVRLGPLVVIAGLRSDLWTYYDQVRTAVDPRLSFRLEALRGVFLKGNLGIYHQAPSPVELAETFGNPDLPLEWGAQGGAGFEVWLTPTTDVDAQVFYRNAYDIADFVVSPTAFFASGAARVQPIGEQRAYGAEFLLRQRLTRIEGVGGFFGWVSYTLLRSEERADAPKGVDDAEEQRWSPGPFDQTHIVSLAGSYELPFWGLELGAAFRYVTGNPATLAQGGAFDADTGRFRRDNRPFRDSRLPAFVQLDLRVDKRWVFDTWSLAGYLDLQNVTNQQNFEFFQYNYDFREIQGFPGLPILPVFGVEARF